MTAPNGARFWRLTHVAFLVLAAVLATFAVAVRGRVAAEQPRFGSMAT